MATTTPSRRQGVKPSFHFLRGIVFIVLRTFSSGVFLNAVIPFLIYRVTTGQGVPELPALLLAGIVPAADLAWGWLRTRRVSGIALAALGALLVGLVLGLVSNNPFFLLIRDSFVYGLFGLVCWGSLLLARPVSYYLGRYVAARRDLAGGQSYDDRWPDPAFRHRQRLVTFVWGMGLLGLVVLRTLLATFVPVSWFLTLGPGMTLVIAGGLVLWTWRSRARGAGSGETASAQEARR